MLQQQTKVDGQPFSLSELRRRFIEWHEDPSKFLDMTKPEPYGEHHMLFPIKSFDEVTGTSMLGSGAFGKVYGLPNGRVMKTFERDEGYSTFIDFALQNRGNPHVPRIYYRGLWAGRNVVLLEQLTPLEYNHWSDRLADEVRSIVQHRNHEVNPWLNPTIFTQEFIDLCRDLGETYRSDGRLSLDLHKGNIMLRGQTLVITDPFTGSY